MDLSVGDLIRYEWHDWKSPPKQEVVGVVVSIQKNDMIEVFWSGSERTSLVFADALKIISKNNS